MIHKQYEIMENNKPQVIFIHGGDAFRNPEDLYVALRARDFNPYEVRKKWRNEMIKNLDESHECHSLSMPNAMWADYEAWKIWFEKMVPYMRADAILVGHSLGGGFLLRYLTENELPVTVAQLHLVAPCVDDLECEGVGEFKIDLSIWNGFKSDIKSVHLWHSEDDTLVPIHHSERFVETYPTATLHRFTDRGHFLIESFPELELVIKNQSLT